MTGARRSLAVAGLVTVLVVLLGATGRAAAYPQFQLSTGNDRCTACHLSPAGGGLLSEYGRDEAGSTISNGGDGRLLGGRWSPPSWLALGADLRVAGLAKRISVDRDFPGYLDDQGAPVSEPATTITDTALFPMQADVYAQAGGRGVTFNLTLGLRGAARGRQPGAVEYLASREHYLMYERPSGLYARAGRFQPVFGLRSQDHTAYVRRYLGQHTLEEPYGLAVGKHGVRTEWHLSAFVPPPVARLGTGRARGLAGYLERRFMDDTAALAVQARLDDVPGGATRATAGLVGKRWLPQSKLMVLAELDVAREWMDGPIPSRTQLAWHLSGSRFVAPGVMVGAGLQRWEPDLVLRSTARDAVEVNLQYFPRAHVELHLLLRAEMLGGDADHLGLVNLLQVHYYL